MDIESHIDNHFSDVKDWEVNFQMIKDQRHQLKQIPEKRKIDCITININPFKVGIEEVFKKISEALQRTLENSIDRDRDAIEQFVKKSQEQLSSNPQSVEEIEAMNMAAMQIEEQKQQYVDMFEILKKKNNMLKQIQG